MMKTYRVERMDNESYANYMMGGWTFRSEFVEVEAETTAEAARAVARTGYTVLERTIKEADADWWG